MHPLASKKYMERVGPQTLKIWRDSGHNITMAAENIGISYSTMRNRLQSMISKGMLERSEYEQYAEINGCGRAPHKHDVNYREKYEQTQKKLDLYEALTDHATQTKFGIRSYAPSNSNAVAVAVASDWHIGEAVDAADLPGNLNTYNPQIAQRRAEQFFQRTIYLLEKMARGVAQVDTLVLALLGDLMTGHLHEDQSESNHLPPIQEVLLLEEVISAGIEYMLAKGKLKKLILPCCPGNHGRTSEKMRCKTIADTSFEIMLYRHLANRWRKEKRLEWHIATGYQVMLKLWDYTIRFHHGDAVNYGGGVGGITIPLRKAISGWDTVQHANLSVCGHFHQLTDGGDFIVNGSLIGYNAYALRVKARYESPQQAFFIVDHKRGKTATARIFTDYLP
jgi:hypothetical protein